ncbi:MAG: adenine phosphoribosyltransferase [Verrucomicrobiota bacterium]
MSQIPVDKLRAAVRDVPDFPKPGVLFKDITPLLEDPHLFDLSVNALLEPIADTRIDKIVGIDARGFIFGAAAAQKLNAGLVLIRKKGKLPFTTHSLSYALEYGEGVIEIHTDSIKEGENVLILDDLLATGGTAAAAQQLVEKVGGTLVATGFLIELDFLKGRERLAANSQTYAILNY